MKLIVGLGNPGKEYENTKHNLGFRVLDEIIRSEKFITSNHFAQTGESANPVFKYEKYCNAEIFKGRIENEDVLLAKPHTFMNNSGSAVKKLVDMHDISHLSDIIVVHDEISVELGKMKISHMGSAGHHNGVQSIMNHLGASEFVRVRLGIGRGEGALHEVVLSKFRPEDTKMVSDMITRSVQACYVLVEDGVERAMSRFNSL